MLELGDLISSVGIYSVQHRADICHTVWDDDWLLIQWKAPGFVEC